MSAYGWPRGPRRRRGLSAQRRAYAADLRAGAAPDAEAGALLARRTAESALPALAPDGATNLWLPLGPDGTLLGSGDSDPRVAGRVRDLAVSPSGMRIYAATAMGGLWYSADAGATWAPVGEWARTADRATLAASSTTLSCGAVHVTFAADDTLAGDDEVWVGTGEPDSTEGTPDDDGEAGGDYGGVGILHAVGPAVAPVADPTDPGGYPWTPQAPGLRGHGVFTLATDPGPAAGQPRRLVAATTAGLYTADPAALAGDDPWSLVTVDAWETAALLGAGGSSRAVVTDVVWVSGRMWVAVAGSGMPAGMRGLWRSHNGVDGPFEQVALPAPTPPADPTGATLVRLGLAAAPSDATVLYALGARPHGDSDRAALWRVDGDDQVRGVAPIPTTLFDGQGHYDLALAVHPTDAGRVVVGGASVTSDLDSDHPPSAALFRLALTATATGPWRTDYAGNGANDGCWIGAGVHPDVHRISWATGNGATTLVVACDGGVFRSAGDGDQGTFVARNSGLAVTQVGFLASHPTSDGIVLIGVQDNGVQLRIGDSVWRRALQSGDGGGVAFDPLTPGRFVSQYTNAVWSDQDDATIDPTDRNVSADSPAQVSESGAARFYSNAAVVANGVVTQLAVGTTRVWYSENWGHSFTDQTANVFRRDWVTLPSGTDPRAGDRQDTATDTFRPHDPHRDDVATVRKLRWADPDRLYALLPGAVFRFVRSGGDHPTWTRTEILTRAPTPDDPSTPEPAVASPLLPWRGTLNDLAVHDASAGSFYLATSHPEEPVWFFDGKDTVHPSTLGVLAPDGVRAPAYAVVVDPTDPAVVYAGTTVGVWKGTLTTTSDGPTWHWVTFANGLPEAAVLDLDIASWGPIRLLRAAVSARGVWELDLTGPGDGLTHLRAHPYDTRRRLPTVMTDPLPPPQGHADKGWHLDWADVRARDFRAGRTPADAPDGTHPGDFSWHASPDLRLRPAPGAPAPPAPVGPDPHGRLAGSLLPWTRRGPADRSLLWALQTALHGLDPLIVPDGRWTAMFRLRLRRLRHPTLGLSDAAVVDEALWNHPLVQAAFWAPPFADGGPTETDLVERIVGIPTPRPGGVASATVSPVGGVLPAGPAEVHVCVHHRSADPLPPTGLAVTVLRTRLPDDPATWTAIPAPPLADLAAALDAAPADGQAQLVTPAGWTAADATRAVRRPAGPGASAVQPVVLTFEMDLTTGADPGSRWLLLALVRAGATTLNPAGVTTLRDLVLACPQAAARSFEIAP